MKQPPNQKELKISPSGAIGKLPVGFTGYRQVQMVLSLKRFPMLSKQIKNHIFNWKFWEFNSFFSKKEYNSEIILMKKHNKQRAKAHTQSPSKTTKLRLLAYKSIIVSTNYKIFNGNKINLKKKNCPLKSRKYKDKSK